jgi:hypothetical protein
VDKLNMWAVGMRKFYFGVLTVAALFVIAMWAPGIDAATRQAAINAMWMSGGLVAGTMMGENFAKKS